MQQLWSHGISHQQVTASPVTSASRYPTRHDKDQPLQELLRSSFSGKTCQMMQGERKVQEVTQSAALPGQTPEILQTQALAVVGGRDHAGPPNFRVQVSRGGSTVPVPSRNLPASIFTVFPCVFRSSHALLNPSFGPQKLCRNHKQKSLCVCHRLRRVRPCSSAT